MFVIQQNRLTPIIKQGHMGIMITDWRRDTQKDNLRAANNLSIYASAYSRKWNIMVMDLEYI